MKTYIPGKDAALEDSIAKLQHALHSRGFNVVEHSWGNPAPNVWWVHIRDADCPLCFTNGKGATKKAALASAYGEYIERLSCNYFFADFYLGNDIAQSDFVHYPDEKWFLATDALLSQNCPHELLDETLIQHFDVDKNLRLHDLVDINSGNRERGICAIPFTRQSDGVAVYIPVNIIANLYVSNGMSAGNTQAEARTQALSEVFERFVKNKIIAEGLALPEIPDDVLVRFPKTQATIDALKNEGYIIHAFDASLGGQFPVICVTLINRDNGGCFASFGAHPCFEVALERTVTELLQGRGLQEMDIFSPPVFDNDLVADVHNLETHFIDSSGLVSWDLFNRQKDFDFVDWNYGDSTANECDVLMNMLSDLGADVYIADYDYLGVYACRVIVPGISEIYPFEELTQYNNNVGIAIRDSVLALPKTNDTTVFAELLGWLDDSGLDDSELVRQVLGLATGAAADTDNPWTSLRLGELRCFLLLAVGELEEALDMADWVLMFASSTMSHSRKRFFACLMDCLQLSLDETRDIADYELIHRELYGDDMYEASRRHINGEQRFYGLTAISSHISELPVHRQLLKTYQKWQACKH